MRNKKNEHVSGLTLPHQAETFHSERDEGLPSPSDEQDVQRMYIDFQVR